MCETRFTPPQPHTHVMDLSAVLVCLELSQSSIFIYYHCLGSTSAHLHRLGQTFTKPRAFCSLLNDLKIGQVFCIFGRDMEGSITGRPYCRLSASRRYSVAFLSLLGCLVIFNEFKCSNMYVLYVTF